MAEAQVVMSSGCVKQMLGRYPPAIFHAEVLLVGLANPQRTTMTLHSCNRRRSRRFVAEQVLVYVSANGESFRFPTLSLCQSSAIIGHFTPRCHPMLLQHLVPSWEPQYRPRYYWSQFAHRRQLFLQPIIFTRLPNSVVQTILLLLLLSPSSRIPHPPSPIPHHPSHSASIHVSKGFQL